MRACLPRMVQKAATSCADWSKTATIRRSIPRPIQ